MRILIDADGCPVVNLAINIAGKYQIECILLCDTAHVMNRPGAKTITLGKGADSVDFALVNLAKPGDIVITQDYGLAAMCLARGCLPMDQNGRIYHEGNIDALLFARYTARKIRQGGGRLKGPSKRTEEQDLAFESALKDLLLKETRKDHEI